MAVTADPTLDELLTRAAALAPLVRAHAEALEQARCLPMALVDAFREADFFRLWIPCALGGLETEPATLFRVVESVAALDGSAGWNLMVGASSAVGAA